MCRLAGCYDYYTIVVVASEGVVVANSSPVCVSPACNLLVTGKNDRKVPNSANEGYEEQSAQY
jgi:hypothetical protein